MSSSFFGTIVIAVTILFVSNAQAADDMYPCNLELMRPTVVSSGVADATGVTTSTVTGSFTARAYVEDQTQDVNSPLRFRWLELTAPAGGAWGALFPPTSEFYYRIQSIEFPQSTEVMGASYRVGFCYLGPTAAIAPGSSTDASQGSYDFVGTINTGILPEDVPYQGRVTGVCDLRSAGANQAARGATELFPTVLDADAQWSINLGALTSGEMSFDQIVNTQVAQAPRFCKINVEVDETSTGSRPWSVSLNESQITLQIDKNLL